MKTGIVTLFVLCLLFPAGAQQKSIKIKILPIETDVISNFLVIASDEEGNPIYEYLIAKEELKTGSLHHIIIDTTRMTHLSVVKEYFVDTVNYGYPFTRATSYYDIQTDLDVQIEVEPMVCEPIQLLPVVIKVLNVEDVEDVFYYTKRNRYDRWRMKEDYLRIQLDHERGENIFIVIKSTLESDYKYLYIEDTDVEKLLTFSWHDLPSDLEKFIISLPVEKNWNGTVSTISTTNSTECMLFNRKRIEDEIDNVSFFFPLSQTLGPTRINLSYRDQNTIDSPIFSYFINTGIPSNLPLFEDEKFQINSYFANQGLVSFVLNDFPEAFQFTYLKSSIDFIKSQLPLTTTSSWTVIGYQHNSINFNLPKISSYIKQKFLSLDDRFGNWYSIDRVLLYKTLGSEVPSLSDLLYDRCSTNLISVYKSPLK